MIIRDKMYSKVKFLDNDQMATKIIILSLDTGYVQYPIGWKQSDFKVHMKKHM